MPDAWGREILIFTYPDKHTEISCSYGNSRNYTSQYWWHDISLYFYQNIMQLLQIPDDGLWTNELTPQHLVVTQEPSPSTTLDISINSDAGTGFGGPGNLPMTLDQWETIKTAINQLIDANSGAAGYPNDWLGQVPHYTKNQIPCGTTSPSVSVTYDAHTNFYTASLTDTWQFATAQQKAEFGSKFGEVLAWIYGSGPVPGFLLSPELND